MVTLRVAYRVQPVDVVTGTLGIEFFPQQPSRPMHPELNPQHLQLEVMLV